MRVCVCGGGGGGQVAGSISKLQYFLAMQEVKYVDSCNGRNCGGLQVLLWRWPVCFLIRK